jgi:hypothetical protein
VRVALGLKAHSGWAALVVLGEQDGELVVVDRRRIELVEEQWAKQPYHAAEEVELNEARGLVKRGIAAANRIALREMRLAIKREERRNNDLVGCGLLVTAPMPKWTVDEILAVHFRMHKAEGVLFRDALSSAAKKADVALVEIPEKSATLYAAKALKVSADELSESIKMLGKSAGPPWGKDQKEAALAATVVLCALT